MKKSVFIRVLSVWGSLALAVTSYATPYPKPTEFQHFINKTNLSCTPVSKPLSPYFTCTSTGDAKTIYAGYYKDSNMDGIAFTSNAAPGVEGQAPVGWVDDVSGGTAPVKGLLFSTESTGGTDTAEGLNYLNMPLTSDVWVVSTAGGIIVSINPKWIAKS